MPDKITELPDFGLAFDEEKHLYTLNGLPLPSVTTIMKPLSQFEYKGIREDTLAHAATKGSSVHNAIELYLKFGIEDIPPEHAGYFQAFKQWLADYKPKTVGSEARMYHKTLLYAGTADWVGYIGDELVMVDYKTTYKLIDMLVSVQLEAYERALESHGLNIQRKGALQLKKDGTYKFVTYGPHETDKWVVFTSLVNVYNYCNKQR